MTTTIKRLAGRQAEIALTQVMPNPQPGTKVQVFMPSPVNYWEELVLMPHGITTAGLLLKRLLHFANLSSKLLPWARKGETPS